MVQKKTKERWISLTKKTGKVLPEHQEQVLFVDWVHETYPDLLIYAIPNGGHSSEGMRTKLKAEGMLHGMPDLHIPELNLWIEMKRTKGGVVSQYQKDVIKRLQAIGHTAVVCYGFEEAKGILQKARLQAPPRAKASS